MSADIIGAAYRGYFLDHSGLLLPEVASERQRQRFYIIGTHVTGAAVQRDVLRLAPGASIDRGEAMIMLPGPVFDAAAREYVAMQERERIVVRGQGA